MSDYIPDEIWPEIFKKSTPETLIICRCVCKSWKSLISSQYFIDIHIAAQKPHLIIQEPNHLQESTAPPPQNYVVFSPQNLPRLDLRFLAHTPSFRIVGTSSGVVCISIVDEYFESTNDVVLWNPSIRKFIFPCKNDSGYALSTIGFGFDPLKNDLKVVRVTRVIKFGLFRHRVLGRIPPKAEVFSVRERRWREIGYNFPSCHTFNNRVSQCLVNGAAHWPAYSSPIREALLSFHFEREEFKIIRLPPQVKAMEVSVSKLGNLLSVLHYKRAVGGGGARGCDVWAMKEYDEASSWCKIARIDWDWGGGGMGSVVWVREDVGEMIVSTENGEMLRYDTRNREAKPIGIQCGGDGFFADGFVRSLGLLDVS